MIRQRLLEIARPVTLGFAFLGAVWAFSSTSHAQGATAQESVTIKAEVIAVDKENRTATLKDKDGDEVVVAATPEMTNFDKIVVGDTIVATFMVTVDVFIDESGAGAEITESDVAQPAAGGEPGGVMASSLRVSAPIKAIDKENRVLTLELEEGVEVEKAVDPDIAAFDQLKVGDTVNVRVTRALAVDVVHHNHPK